MGKVWSAVTRPLRNINVESRAQRVIDKGTKVAVSAPKHASTKDAIKQFSEEHPEVLNEQQTKNEHLLYNLKNMKVDSYGPAPEIRSSNLLKKQLRPDTKDDHNEFGVEEPDIIPIGKVSIRQVLEMITLHNTSPKEYTVSVMAKEYKLDEAIVQQVFKYFQTLNMFIPKRLSETNKNFMKYFKTTKNPELEGKEGKHVKISGDS